MQMTEVLQKTKDILQAHKKKLIGIVIVIVLLSAASAGFQAIFQVKGVVTNVTESRITVANFFRTQTINLTGVPVNTTTIQLGDRAFIQKNLQGNILYVTVRSSENHKEKSKDWERGERGGDKDHF
ncbi:hypothetical protein F9B85_11980 [Heliorestis acidaminivorans]|uniref:Uncharacterized protein n=1 Tax=Heliorestis acidaminivorans TaxID=553427 RepID=A0A6I0EY52_9FIRM|nr:hypothetical protein [Heliorestis acidaminivorans]KAB2951519.1 hypothetical protein F9B85_11980 [Heliorestis acidaminivorans]